MNASKQEQETEKTTHQGVGFSVSLNEGILLPQEDNFVYDKEGLLFRQDVSSTKTTYTSLPSEVLQDIRLEFEGNFKRGIQGYKSVSEFDTCGTGFLGKIYVETDSLFHGYAYIRSGDNLTQIYMSSDNLKAKQAFELFQSIKLVE